MKLNIFSGINNIISNKNDIKVVKGDKKEIEEIIDVLKDASLKIYGSEYEELVDTVLRDIKIYSCDDIYDLNEIVNRKYPWLEEADYQKDGFFITNKLEKSVFLIKENNINILAHELFGHAVSSQKNDPINYNNKLYGRIGFEYRDYQTGKIKNTILNEGFTINFEDEIISQIDKDLIRSHSAYKLGGKIASAITENMDKKKIIKAYHFGVPIYSLFKEEDKEKIIQTSIDLDDEYDLYTNQKSIDSHAYYKRTDRALEKLYEDKEQLVKCLRK